MNIDKSSVHRILTKDLEMKFVCSVWVPATRRTGLHAVECRGILRAVSEDKISVYCAEDET